MLFNQKSPVDVVPGPAGGDKHTDGHCNLMTVQILVPMTLNYTL